jgi:hypothetical protein
MPGKITLTHDPRIGYVTGRQIRQGNWSAATELLGEANPFRDSGRSGPGIPNVDGGIKIEASMCNLRGLLMQKLGKSDQAKACFMEALALDVKCFDAFQQLLNSNMMTPDEGDATICLGNSLLTYATRMGVRSRIGICNTDASGCLLRPDDVYYTGEEV